MGNGLQLLTFLPYHSAGLCIPEDSYAGYWMSGTRAIRPQRQFHVGPTIKSTAGGVEIAGTNI